MSRLLITMFAAFVALAAAYLGGCGGGGGGGGSGSASADAAEEPPPVVGAYPGLRPTLRSTDFTFLGHYIVKGSMATDLGYGQGFTHRYVNGELRFLIQAYNSGNHLLLEVPQPATFGASIATPTARWADIWSPFDKGNGRHRSLWWDVELQRLWTTYGIDYPNNTDMVKPGSIIIRDLNGDGTISNLRGEFGMVNVGQRAIYGGVQRVPAWFRTEHDVGKYVVGFGGYTSRMAQGLVPGLGLTMFAIPEPTQLANGGLFLPAQYKILADHRLGTVSTADWYSASSPAAFDRGVRNPDVINHFDGGNHPSPSTVRYWVSPSPDGDGRWTWGDSFYNTGMWIDNDLGTRARHGFVAIGTFFSGHAWYQTSTLHCERRTAEIQVFDPEHLAEVSKGTRAGWNVKPVAKLDITANMRGPATPNNLGPRSGNGADGAASGATFDPLTNRLYIKTYNVGNGGTQPDGAIYVFQVGGV